MKNDETVILYTYDALDRLVSVTYPDRSEVTYSYDPSGNLVSVSVHPREKDEKQPPSGSTIPISSGQQPPMQPRFCPQCHQPFTAGKKFCSNCGAPVSAPAPSAPVTAAPPPSSVCAACGNPIKPGAKFCAKCGRRRT